MRSEKTVLSKLFCFPSENRSSLKEKNLLTSFLFELDPFQKGFDVQERSCFTCRKGLKSYPVYLVPSKLFSEVTCVSLSLPLAR